MDFIKLVPIAIIIIPSFAQVFEAKTYTQECILRADYSSCVAFNSCCEFRCSRARQKRSTCTTNGTGINQVQTECVCTTQTIIEPHVHRRSRHSRLELVAGILFLFVLDMLLLSFTF